MRGIKRQAFTLIESLVVLALSVALLSILSVSVLQMIQTQELKQEQDTIGNHQAFAMTRLEQDIRLAAHVKMPSSAGGMAGQYDRLVLVLQSDNRKLSDDTQELRVVYGLKSNVIENSTLPGTPKAPMVLYRRIDVGVRKGNADPLAMYLNRPSNDSTQSGIVVTYLDQDMAPCGLEGDVHFIRVRLNSMVSNGTLQSREEVFPMMAKKWYEKGGG